MIIWAAAPAMNGWCEMRTKSKQEKPLLFAFTCFAVSVKAGAANQLSPAIGTLFLLAVRMMVPTRHNITVGTAEPARKMRVSRIIGDGLKNFSIRILDRGIPRASRDGCVRHLLPTTPANSHSFLAAISNFLSLDAAVASISEAHPPMRKN